MNMVVSFISHRVSSTCSSFILRSAQINQCVDISGIRNSAASMYYMSLCGWFCICAVLYYVLSVGKRGYLTVDSVLVETYQVVKRVNFAHLP